MEWKNPLFLDNPPFNALQEGTRHYGTTLIYQICEITVLKFEKRLRHVLYRLNLSLPIAVKITYLHYTHLCARGFYLESARCITS